MKILLQWQALDRQRAMEISIRRSKQELVMFDKASKNVTLPEEKRLRNQEFNRQKTNPSDEIRH